MIAQVECVCFTLSMHVIRNCDCERKNENYLNLSSKNSRCQVYNFSTKKSFSSDFLFIQLLQNYIHDDSKLHQELVADWISHPRRNRDS